MQTRMKLNGAKWGGIRENSGRPRIRSKGVAHRKREKVSLRTPLHINFRYSEHVRNKETLKILKKAIQNARKHGLIVLQYSFQSNHVHLIVEAANNQILTRAMRSLTITFAKTLNRGRIQVERYHLHVLKTAKEVKHAVHYVLFNQQKHERGIYSTVSEYSSLLFSKDALVLIRNFAKEKKWAIKIQKGGEWEADEPESYLYKRGLAVMTRPAQNYFPKYGAIPS